jgi:hypothetical protein
MNGLSPYRATSWNPFGNFWQATSPADFWSKWNPGLHNAYLALLVWVRRTTGLKWTVPPTMLFIFFFNGLWHHLLITKLIFREDGFFFIIFFMLQFVVVATEKTLKLRAPLLPATLKRFITLGYIICSSTVAKMIDHMLL